jgi:hypothetical protein
MALSTVQANNKLVQYTQQINREYVRENLFSPYMGEASNAIIRLRMETKRGGEQMNIPLVARLIGQGKSSGTLVGSEEAIDDYGYRIYVDYARNAVKTNKYQQQIDSADVFGEARPLLADWGKELQRDETIGALMALPAESAPAGLASDAGQRINGILYEDATAAQRNTWNTDNQDRILYGNTTANFNAVHATALANVNNTNSAVPVPTDGVCTGQSVQLLKYIARHCFPRIRPFKIEDGREYFVLFAGGLPFRNLKRDLQLVNKDARPREGRAMNDNPIFQDGDLVYDGVIIREIPEIDEFVAQTWTSLLTAGAASVRVNPVFLCGQTALTFAWGQMAKPTFLREDDYQFYTGVGVEMCYGIGKVFKKVPKTGTALKQWGVVTGFFGNTST